MMIVQLKELMVKMAEFIFFNEEWNQSAENNTQTNKQ
jgi:hypothetical protein